MLNTGQSAPISRNYQTRAKSAHLVTLQTFNTYKRKNK